MLRRSLQLAVDAVDIPRISEQAPRFIPFYAHIWWFEHLFFAAD